MMSNNPSGWVYVLVTLVLIAVGVTLTIVLNDCEVKPKEPHVVGLADNGTARQFKEGTWVVFWLKAYRDDHWEPRSREYSNVCGSTRVRGDVTGDPEYDVFPVLVTEGRMLRFRLLDKDGNHIRDFTFTVYVRR